MPYNYILTTGTIIPDTSTLKTEVQTEWRAALGEDLTLDDETPQGVLINAEVESRIASAQNNATLANQINPDLAGGIFLDAICGLSGIVRAPATKTAVLGVRVSGQPSTFIPAGSRARTGAGDVFATDGSVLIDGSGEAFINFTAVEYGPVPAPIGALSFIVDAVLGWETVENFDAGILGADDQSDEELRTLRRLTLARSAMSVSEAVVSDLYAIPEVRSLQFRENITASPATIDGILIGAHSIWVCVDGGTDDEIAAALLRSKTAGAGWTGAVSVNVTDPFSGQIYPVDFDRPEEKDILARVTVRRGTFVGDITQAVRDAVMAYANGQLPGDPGFVVGGAVSPFELGGAVMREVLGIHVSKVEVASPTGPMAFQTTEIVLDVDQVPRIIEGSITVIEI